MTLDQETIAAIAAEVVRQSREQEGAREDARLLARLPVAEVKRRQHARLVAVAALQRQTINGLENALAGAR